MLLDIVKKGSVDRSVVVRIIDSADGTPETAVVFNSSGIDLWYRREGAAKTSLTEASLSALTDAHADGGFLHIGDGYYRLDLPDAAFATGANHVDVGGTVTGMVVIGGRVRLVNYDPEDAVRLGLTALPNAAADAAGGLPISDAGGLDLDGRLDASISSRAAASIFTGITSLAQWLGLIAGKQTGNSTARTELRATGAGSGTFDETTDSQEALRDRGDAAWTTATGFSTHSAADVWAVGTRTLTAFSFAVDISAAAVSLIWDKATSALTTVGSIGKLLVDNIDAAISSRLATAGYTTPPTVGQIADQVWEEPIADHSGTAGSTAEQLAAAGSAGDPWATALPGSYASGQAGKIVGDNLNTTISSRATQTSVDDLPTNAELATALASADDAVLSAIAALNNLSAAQVNAEVDQAISDAALATATALAAAKTVVDAIKLKTDNLPASPAATGDAMTLTAAYDAAKTAASQTSVDDLPTNAELATALAAADDAVLAAVAAARTVIDAIDAKTTNLPSDPADQSLIIAATNALASAIAALNNLSSADVKTQADQALIDIGATVARMAKLDALPVRLRKNTAFANFQFLMVDSADHRTGKTGLTVTAQRVLDNGAIAACANSVTEIGSGLYRIDLAASDVNGNIVSLLFTATGADARIITAVLQEAA